ncbi:MAG: nucleotidyltransferase family protein [Candidatus Omnitrophica bacterium]|nr:nucleotidyltransferase family protein [Candidatus Omnitrophota bacterium]
MSWPKEDRIVFACSRINVNAKLCQEIKENLNSDLNWDYLLKTAEDDGVISLLYRILKDFGNGLVPDRVGDILKRNYLETTARNFFILSELSKALKAFADNEIPVIVLKGASFLENIYQDIGLRPIGDVDILIKKERLPQIDSSLKEQGYSSPHRWADYIDKPDTKYLNSISYVKGPIHLHIHWHIINTSIATYLNINEIKMDRFWQEARPASIAGVESLAMASHHLLIHLSEHSFTHAYDRLILLCDISEIINYCNSNGGLNWELFLEDTLLFNLNIPAFYSLYFASKLINAQVPAAVLNKLQPEHSGYPERLVKKWVLENKRIPELRYLIPLMVMNENLRQRLRYICKSLFLPKQVITQKDILPCATFPLFHYALRIKNCFRKGLRILGYLLQ